MREPKNDDGSQMSGEQRAQHFDKVQEEVAMTLGASRKASTGWQAGQGVASYLDDVRNVNALRPAIDCRETMREWIDKLGTKQTTWARVSRNAAAIGTVLPGRKVIRPSCVGMFLDVSSSMDRTKARQALEVAQSALDDKACDAIEVWLVDTEVQSIKRYEIGDEIQPERPTGGGTAFDKAMERVPLDGQDMVAIVFVTDGQTSAWGDDPGIPVLWAITDTQPNTDKLKPPYGETLCLYNS